MANFPFAKHKQTTLEESGFFLEYILLTGFTRFFLLTHKDTFFKNYTKPFTYCIKPIPID